MAEHTDRGPILGAGGIYLFLSAVTLLGVGAGWAWLDDPSMRWASPIAFAVAVVPWAITLYRYKRLRSALGEADLHLDDSIPMGYSGTATYFRPLRGGAQLRAIQARLQCEEEVIKGSRNKNKQVRKIVYDEEVTPSVSPAMERLEVRLPLRIPPTGPPTIWFSEARITWWLRLNLKMSGCPNTASSFEITVLPAVYER